MANGMAIAFAAQAGKQRPKYSDLVATRGFERPNGRNMYLYTAKGGGLYLGLEVEHLTVSSRHDAAWHKGPLPPRDAPLGTYGVLALIPVSRELAAAVCQLTESTKTTPHSETVVQALREGCASHWLVCRRQENPGYTKERRVSRKQMRAYGYL
jgi:hypothetical protein